MIDYKNHKVTEYFEKYFRFCRSVRSAEDLASMARGARRKKFVQEHIGRQMKTAVSIYIKVVVAGLMAIGAGAASAMDDYLIQPGDVLAISVWKEADLQGDVLVRPDGKFSFPLTGDIVAKSRSVEDVRADVAEKISKFIPEPVVTVQVRQILGNKVYVIGKVNRPGEFPLVHDMDVVQALSVAGGMATFASVNNIKILRRSDSSQTALSFEYGDIEDGDNLEQNVMLQAGDIVVVP